MVMNEVQTISNLLNEEKWTRATLNNYIIKNFTDLDKLIKDAKESGTLSEIRQVCSEHLKHTPNSIIALYVIGKLNFEEEALDEGHIQKLITLFIDNKRFNIAEFLAKEILKYGENKYAIEALIQCATNENKEDELISLWERLVKIDYEDTDIVRRLATIKEKEGKIEEAVDYYKKALLRNLRKGLYNPVEEIWLKLVELTPDDLNFFLAIEKRIASEIGEDKAAFLLSFVFPYYKDKGEYDIAIDILKKILSYAPKDREAREELISCYREKYKNHSRLEDYIKLSNLEDHSQDINSAIDTFEKHIIFDAGSYVYHRSWGIGICKEVKEDYIIVDFNGKKDHKMKLQMALTSLQILPENHIWLLKSKDKAKLKELVLNDVEEGLKIIIKSKNNEASVKDFKNELLGDIFDKKEWTRWWNKAKSILKKNPYFGIVPEKKDVYFIRKKPISYAEDVFNNFKTEKKFNKRFDLFLEFLEHGDIDSEYFGEMLEYFQGFLTSSSTINENSLKSFLLLSNLKRTYPYLPIEIPFGFKEIYESLKDIYNYLPLIQDNDLKKSLLLHIKRNLEDWPNIFIKCFYIYPMKTIIDELISEGYQDLVKSTFNEILSHYRDYSEIFIWIGKNIIAKQVYPQIEIDFDHAIMGLTHLLEISSRELNYDRNVITNRKIFNTIVDILFKDNLLIDYIKKSDEATVKRLIPTILNIEELKDEYIIKMRFAIKTAHPSIVFDDEVESVNVPGQLVVTQRSYELKQNELKYLLEVEIPKNSKEIGIAMEKGDLRENAEYKYALEKQEFLKQQVKGLRESLNKAKILKPEDIRTNVVSIGTMITLNSVDNDKTEKFTILGPWESDPVKKVISYTSPLGETLMNKSVGDTVDLVSQNTKKRYKILKIERALF